MLHLSQIQSRPRSENTPPPRTRLLASGGDAELDPCCQTVTRRPAARGGQIGLSDCWMAGPRCSLSCTKHRQIPDLETEAGAHTSGHVSPQICSPGPPSD